MTFNNAQKFDARALCRKPYDFTHIYKHVKISVIINKHFDSIYSFVQYALWLNDEKENFVNVECFTIS